jgi:hypothetical protein
MAPVIEFDSRPEFRPAIQHRIPGRIKHSWISERVCKPRSVEPSGAFFIVIIVEDYYSTIKIFPRFNPRIIGKPGLLIRKSNKHE